jgi:hypothetical protein
MMNVINLRIAKQAIGARRGTRQGAHAGRAQGWRTMLVVLLP